MSVSISYKAIQNPTSMRWKLKFTLRTTSDKGLVSATSFEPQVSAGTLAEVKNLLGTEAVRTSVWTQLLRAFAATGGVSEVVPKNRPSIYEGKPKLQAPPPQDDKANRIRAMYDRTRTALGSPVVAPGVTFIGENGQQIATGGVQVEVRRQVGKDLASAQAAAPTVHQAPVVAQPMRAAQLAKEFKDGMAEVMRRAKALGITVKHPNNGLTGEQVAALRAAP